MGHFHVCSYYEIIYFGVIITNGIVYSKPRIKLKSSRHYFENLSLFDSLGIFKSSLEKANDKKLQNGKTSLK